MAGGIDQAVGPVVSAVQNGCPIYHLTGQIGMGRIDTRVKKSDRRRAGWCCYAIHLVPTGHRQCPLGSVGRVIGNPGRLADSIHLNPFNPRVGLVFGKHLLEILGRHAHHVKPKFLEMCLSRPSVCRDNVILLRTAQARGKLHDERSLALWRASCLDHTNRQEKARQGKKEQEVTLN